MTNKGRLLSSTFSVFKPKKNMSTRVTGSLPVRISQNMWC